jgi:hypothetical protein
MCRITDINGKKRALLKKEGLLFDEEGFLEARFGDLEFFDFK